MKILPLAFTPYTKPAQDSGRSKFNISLNFEGKDSFKRSGSFFEKHISDLQSDIESIVNPYIEQHKTRFLQLGKIGYDSQEKLKLINKYETGLMQKKLSAFNSDEFASAAQNANLYEKYMENIKEFERTEQFVKSHPVYSTDKILNTIEKGKIKIHRDDAYFEQLKPFYDKYQSVKQSMDLEFARITSKNNPEFFEKIKKLDEQNKTAVMLFLVSGYPDAAEITKEAGEIVKCCKNGKVSYDILKKFEKINYKIQKFQEDRQDNSAVLESIDKFLEENKNYRMDNLSEEEIHGTYKTLLSMTDEVISGSIRALNDYNTAHPVKLSPRITDRAFKIQAKVNRAINNLIQEEKEKFYGRINSEY